MQSTQKFKTVIERLEQEMDTMRINLSDKMSNNHQQVTKKINIANYELENHRSDIMRLKSQVQQLTETSQATTEQFTALDLKVDQCDKTVSKISSDTLSKKQYR